jgi:hypothetical protein
VMMRCSVTRALFKTILLSCNKLYYIWFEDTLQYNK